MAIFKQGIGQPSLEEQKLKEAERQRQGSQTTAMFQRPKGPPEFRGARLKTGPGTVRGKAPVGESASNKDFRRSMQGQTTIAPTLQSKRIGDLLANFHPSEYEHPSRRKRR